MKDADIIGKFCNIRNLKMDNFGKEASSSATSELNTASTSDTRIDILGGAANQQVSAHMN